MKILLTGASSFTGMHFVRALAARGHDVYLTFTKKNSIDYPGIRRKRVDLAVDAAAGVYWGLDTGSVEFRGILRSGAYDVLCHHAAETRGYRDPDFDVLLAVRNNVSDPRRLVEACKQGGMRIVLTGTYFEQGEGGHSGLRAATPYGLSKTLTRQLLGYYCQEFRVRLQTFVVPNPFGPYEDDDKFTSYLARSWAEGKTPVVRTHNCRVDNVPVDLLARAYADYVEDKGDVLRHDGLSPSGYATYQSTFVQTFAHEIGKRWPEIKTIWELLPTPESAPERAGALNLMRWYEIRGRPWDEGKFWDELADHYIWRYTPAG